MQGVFPACAGMNRILPLPLRAPRCVPRMRGDEPHVNGRVHGEFHVFPACAGMNRLRAIFYTRIASVPRMRGDEPNKLTTISDQGTCSPHARG